MSVWQKSRTPFRSCVSDAKLHERPQILVADRLSNIPGVVQHLDLRVSVAGTLPYVAER